ncbi:hypothetical protein [Amycolatopsis vastitatis]|uniref:hypothetical protein n=1 Tax=Amycolatopsis vastitatis TaxID=1905142 RepID=UPI001177CD1D|nr:hypothetical protein [Amycolatopsis vastitatis]
MPDEYQEKNEPEFTNKVATTFTSHEAPDGSVLLRGPCPRCGHVTEHLISAGVLRRASRLWSRRADRELPPDEDEDERMCCYCDGEHSGQPDGYRGCGAFWSLKVDRT